MLAMFEGDLSTILCTFPMQLQSGINEPKGTQCMSPSDSLLDCNL